MQSRLVPLSIVVFIGAGRNGKVKVSFKSARMIYDKSIQYAVQINRKQEYLGIFDTEEEVLDIGLKLETGLTFLILGCIGVRYSCIGVWTN